MEIVRQFSSELNSLSEGRPPISRAKMASITKLAMKAVKYYKHTVMNVEKFISKCSTEYKVPGLYVVDSIVRQSRHQFGTEKDVFGPRFAKNFAKTFHHIFKCAEEDKAKVVRVLNLWQKNDVFSPDVIQPLLSLASSAPPSSQHSHSHSHSHSSVPSGGAHSEATSQLDLNSASVIIQQQQQQIQTLLQQQLQSQANNLLGPALQGLIAQTQGPGGTQADTVTALLTQAQQLQQLQAIQQQLVNNSGVAGGNMAVPAAQMSNVEPTGHNQQQVQFNQALLDDFDYSDDEDDTEKRLAEQRERLEQQKTRLEGGAEPEPKPKAEPTSTNDILEQLQQQFRMQESAMATANQQEPSQLDPIKKPLEHPLPIEVSKLSPPPLPPPISSSYPPVPIPVSSVPIPIPIPPPHLNFPRPALPLPPPQHMHDHHLPHPPGPHPPGPPPGPPRDWGHPSHPPPPLPPGHYPPPLPRSPSPRMRRDRYRSPPPMRGRSPSPPSRRHSGHWRERDRWSPRRHSRSPPPSSRDRERRRSRSPRRSPKRRMSSPPPLSTSEREKQRKGIPPTKDKHVTVCSTTIWMGHVAKSVSSEQVVQAFEDFGQVKSVDLVLARGCAYVVMVHRSDAMRALNSLKSLKLNGNTCKLAWAPGRGVKGASYKNYWDLDVGASFVPWDKVNDEQELRQISDGGWIDPSTCPPGMKPPPPPKEEPDPAPEPLQQPKQLPVVPAPQPVPVLVSQGAPILPVPLNLPHPLPMNHLPPHPPPPFQPPPQFPPQGPPLPIFPRPPVLPAQPPMAGSAFPTQAKIAPPLQGREPDDAAVATNDDMQIDNSPDNTTV